MNPSNQKVDTETQQAPTNPKRRLGMIHLASLWIAMSTPLAACGGSDSPPSSPIGTPPSNPPPVGSPPPSPPPPGPTPPPPSAGPAKTVLLNATLSSPWGMAFLPDGRMLVTQKGGTMVILSANGSTKSNPIGGVPVVVSAGQGGLLDVVLDPDYSVAGSNWVYFSYSESGTGGSGTAVSRGRLNTTTNQLEDVTRIFQQLPKVNGDGHFGSRLAFRADKTLFITLGERQQGLPAQDLTSHLGKVVRINRDGSVPSGNGTGLPAGTRPEIWSYGHRNPQGAAIHPTTGELWELEHGPQGGDELNIARSGQNYGWPLVSYGCEYGSTNSGCQIGGGGGVHAPSYTEPVSRWPGPGVATPYYSIAPSGLTFYTGSGFPEWQGNVFLGALTGAALWRVALNGNVETAREQLFHNLDERIRCVRQGPDGWLYMLTDSGKLFRVDR